MRILIEYILPLALPTVLWLAWLAHLQKRARAKGGVDWQAVPWTWLLALGLVLALVIAGGITFTEGYHTGGYHPAAIDDHGRMVPGRFE